jgi:hypothetical protein
MIYNPEIGSRLGSKGNHQRGPRSRSDNLDSKASSVQRHDPVRRINVKVFIRHVGNMAWPQAIGSPISRSADFSLTPPPSKTSIESE